VWLLELDDWSVLTMQQTTAGQEQEQRLSRLRPFNLIVGLIHLAQAVTIFIISNDFSLPITGQFLAGPPGTELSPPDTLFDVPVGPLVGVFLLFAAVDHLLMAAPGVWPWYANSLRRGINPARWWEYSISASLMIVLIALITGIADIAAVIAIFGVNAAMILFGLDMEQVNGVDRKHVNWRPFIYGCIAGAIPWIAITWQIVESERRAVDGGVPTFVYGIFVSLFLLFNSFAINMVLQYKRVGAWRDYLYGERAYIILSLTAKTALAWQIFANTLID
jgi:hypothetical protein